MPDPTDSRTTAKPYLRFEGMTWPHSDDPTEVEWRLRYGQPSKSDLMVAASYIEAYRQLLALPVRTRNARVTGIRRAAKEAS